MLRSLTNFCRLTFWSVFIPLISASQQVHSGAFIGAGDGFESLVLHPPNYSGNGGVVMVRVCIAPSSPNATDMEYSVQNNIDVFNNLIHAHGNLVSAGNNNIPSGALDFESASLHEIGHCLGLAHPNLATESLLTGSDTNYTKTTTGSDGSYDVAAGPDGIKGSSDDVRGDDENLHWFRKSNNDPFTIDTVVDSTTYSRNLADLPSGHSFAANADRAVAASLGYPGSEAVMQQGTFADEAQRVLGHDDVATLRYAMSGVNERESGRLFGTNYADDNYTVVLEYGGISDTGCDISMSMTGTSSLAFCRIGDENNPGATSVGGNHYSILEGTIEFGSAYNWFFNAPNSDPVLGSIGDQTLLDGESLVVDITATDVDANILSFVENGLPSFATLLDNGDGTATLTISAPADASSTTSVTITVNDNGDPAGSDNETFDIIVLLDSDDDGLSDDDEINIYGTSPTDPDTDGDGLSDFDELMLHSTSPTNADSDGDFIEDGDELSNGSDPNDGTSWPNFADGDIAPLGSPDSQVNAADYVLMQRIVLGEISATSLELAHGDLYPAGSPDGVINVSDLILLLILIQ